MASVHPEKDAGPWLIAGRLVGSGDTGACPCLVCDLGTVTGLDDGTVSCLPSRPGSYHSVAEWAEGSWTGHWVSPSHLSVPPNPMQDT